MTEFSFLGELFL